MLNRTAQLAKDRADEARRVAEEARGKEVQLLRARAEDWKQQQQDTLLAYNVRGEVIGQLTERVSNWRWAVWFASALSFITGALIVGFSDAPNSIARSLPIPNEPIIVITPTSFHKAYMDENKHFHQYEDGTIIPTVTHYQTIEP